MFKTKPLALLLGVLLVGTMAFGVITSGAWFTDSDQVAVTATAGKIDIEANPVSFSVSNLLPGAWSDRTEITIYNTANSTTGVKYQLTSDEGTESVLGFYDEITVRVTHRFCGGIDNMVAYEGSLATLAFDNSILGGGFAAPLGVNQTHCFWVEFGLAETTANTFQGASATFDLVFDATQPENPGWTE